MKIIFRAKQPVLLSLLLLVCGALSQNATAEERLIVTRTSLPASKIDGLVWAGDELEIEHRKTNERQEAYVVLKGSYAKPKFDLYAHNRLVSRAVSGSFEIKVRFKEKPVQLGLRAVGPSGSLETEEVLLLKVSRQIPK
ncbi:MAG: hypothetical protein ABIQ95_16760 [Bdellovibrionia bacterium]